MRPNKITLSNFMSHEFSSIDCNLFNSALVVAKEKGDDSISNAVGKSTIFHALEYALYGTYPTPLLEQVVRDGTDKCYVEVEFENQGSELKVKRGRSASGRSDLRLWHKDGKEWVSVSERTMPDTDKKLQEIIGISQKAFRYSVMYGQNDVSALASAKKPEHRREILKEPLQLAIYTKLEKLAKRKVADSKSESASLVSTISLLGNPNLEISDAKKELEDVLGKSTALTDKIDQIEKALSGDKSLYASLSSSLTNKGKQIQDKYHDSLSQLKYLSQDIKNKKDSIESNKVSKASATETLKKHTESIKNIEEEQKQYIVDITITEKLRGALTKVETDYLHGKEITAKLEGQLSNLKSVLPHEESCPQCFQKISEEYRNKFSASREKSIKELNTQISVFKKNIEKCSQHKTKIQQDLREQEKIQTEFESLERKKTSLEQDVAHTKERLAYVSSHLEKEEKELTQLNGRFTRTKETVDSLKEELANDPEKETSKKIIALGSRITKGEETLDKCKGALSTLNGTRVALENRIKKLESDEGKIQKLRDKNKDIEHTIQLEKVVVQAFSPSGIPALMIRSILDELQWESNQVLKSLRPEMEINFSANLDMSYKIRGETKAYEQLSGGQKVYIALSLKMALSKIIQRKVGVDIGFLALDEVDQSLDKAGVEAFAQIIKEWEKDFKIFVITHNDSLKDKFSHAILVEGDGLGVSSAQVVNNW